MPHSSSGTVIILLAIVVVVIGIVLTISHITITEKKQSIYNVVPYNTPVDFKEGFNVAKPFTEYNNQQKNRSCMANQYGFVVNAGDEPVSFRALREPSNFTCPLTMQQADPKDNMYRLQTGTELLEYDLKAVCFKLYVRDITIDDPTSITVIFEPSGFDQLKKMLFLNPLYVEIESSIAYMPIYKDMGILTNVDTASSRPFSLKFQQLNNNAGLKYSAPSAQPLDRQKLSLKGLVSFVAYYPDILDLSAYEYILPMNVDTTKRVANMVIYNTSHDTIYNQGLMSYAEFSFNRKLQKFFREKESPVFTITYSFSMNNAKVEDKNNIVTREILRMYMDVSYGQYSSIDNTIKPIDLDPKINMFSVFVGTVPMSDKFSLVSVIPNTDNGNKFMQEQRIYFELPFSYQNNMFDVVTTYNANEIIVYVKWRDDKNVESYVYARTPSCKRNTLVEQMFTKMKDNSPITQNTENNINIKYDTFYVSTVNKVLLGYRNFNNY